MRSLDTVQPPAALVQGGAVAAVPRPPSGPDACPDVLARLRLHAALPAAEFDTRFLAPIERLDLLLAGPACSLRLCTQIAFHCFQAADGRIFSGRCGVQSRHRLEVRWRYLCFAAGLLQCPRAAVEQGWSAWLPQLLGRDNLDWLDAGGARLSAVLHQLLDVQAEPPGSPGSPAPQNAATGDSGVLDEGRSRVAQLVAGVAQRLHTRDAASAPGACSGAAAVRPAAPAPTSLPPELSARIRDPLQARRLAALCDACRVLAGEGQAFVARTPDGLALALDFLVPIVHDLPRWTEAMAEAGLIHCPPESPGRRLLSWVFIPGAEARPAVFLTELACRRLGL